MHKGYVQQACLPLDEGRSIQRSSGTTARLKYIQLCERPEGFGKREVQNLVLLWATFVHRLLHYWWRQGSLLDVPSANEEPGCIFDLRGTPDSILFHTGFLKRQGVPRHRNRAGHLTLDGKEICRKARASAHKGRQLQAASSFPAKADEPLEIPSQSAQPQVAAEPVPPQPAAEKKYQTHFLDYSWEPYYSII